MDSGDLQYVSKEIWKDLEQLLDQPTTSHEAIDDVLRSYLQVTTQAQQGENLSQDDEIVKYCYSLVDSQLYRENAEYIQRQMLYCLLQDDDVAILRICATVLLFGGQAQESVFEMMQDEGAFARLLGLVRDGHDDQTPFHRLLLELLYETSRVQRLDADEILVADDDFVLYLLGLTEMLSEDARDPYHYHIIRVLLVLNEQYMCLANDSTSASAKPITNRIIKVLSSHGSRYRTFGENLILLLNRESAVTSQILILKLLFLLFTTRPTFEYFYTNDLHVLVDVIIRNLLNLDSSHEEQEEEEGEEEEKNKVDKDGQRVLRHTYLRVLCPLLKNTQLGKEGSHYKRDEIRQVLYLLVNRSSAHFAPVDQTVLRLVVRCRQIDWIRQEGDDRDEELEQRLAIVAPNNSDVAKKLLGMSLEQAGDSALSVPDVAAKMSKEKPAVPAPRRRGRRTGTGLESPTESVHSISIQLPLSRTTSGSQMFESGPDGQSPFADATQDG